MPATIHLISLGIASQAQLPGNAKVALQQAEVIIGSERQIATLEHLQLQQDNPSVQFHTLPSPLKQLTQTLPALNANQMCILASGDGLFYGIGQWIQQQFPQHNLCFYPNISSIQSACHKLGWSLQNVTTLSAHGRPLNALIPHLRRNKKFAILTDHASHPKAIAELLQRLNFNNATLSVCEQLGYDNERISHYTLNELLTLDKTFDPLHVTLIHCLGDGNEITPEFPGIIDNAFITDSEPGKGLITKQAIRLHILAALQPTANDIGWDIGAGCGGVTVEWARYNPLGQVHAIEQHPQRFAILQQNIQKFGVMQNTIPTCADIFNCLNSLPSPNKIFIGGHGNQLAPLLKQCWNALQPGGTLVVSAVTESSKTHCHQFIETNTITDSEWLEVATKKGQALAGQLLMRPSLPVTLISLTKPHNTDQNKQIESAQAATPLNATVESTPKTGTLTGIGLGPGDPSLLTIKAQQCIEQLDVVSYLESPDGTSQAKDIARHALTNNPNAILLPIPMVYKKDRTQANKAYDLAADTMSKYLNEGNNVGFLCEGDPLFYGSFMYLLERLTPTYSCQVIPGITSLQAASSQICQPLCELTQNLAILNGRNSDEAITNALNTFDHLVILKVGQHRAHLLKLIDNTGRTADTTYCENLTRETENITRDVSHLSGDAPYFSLLLVNRQKQRQDK
jgi:precorrin-6B C5,15-methyltransferase / cobalt-precorrin-6B C5,C15-methyltransferase